MPCVTQGYIVTYDELEIQINQVPKKITLLGDAHIKENPADSQHFDVLIQAIKKLKNGPHGTALLLEWRITDLLPHFSFLGGLLNVYKCDKNLMNKKFAFDWSISKKVTIHRLPEYLSVNKSKFSNSNLVVYFSDIRQSQSLNTGELTINQLLGYLNAYQDYLQIQSQDPRLMGILLPFQTRLLEAYKAMSPYIKLLETCNEMLQSTQIETIMQFIYNYCRKLIITDVADSGFLIDIINFCRQPTIDHVILYAGAAHIKQIKLALEKFYKTKIRTVRTLENVYNTPLSIDKDKEPAAIPARELEKLLTMDWVSYRQQLSLIEKAAKIVAQLGAISNNDDALASITRLVEVMNILIEKGKSPAGSTADILAVYKKLEELVREGETFVRKQ